jgi:hypothetical protein
MDPLSALAVVGTSLSIAQTCGAVIWELKKFIDATKLVGHVINALYDDAEAFEKVIGLVQQTVEDPRNKSSLESTGYIASHWRFLKSSLDDAHETLKALASTIAKVSKNVGVLDAARKQLRLQSAGDEIALYRQKLQSYQRTIDITLQAAIL